MVKYYVKRNMSSPVIDFIDDINLSGDKRLYKKIYQYICYLDTYGLNLKEPYIKYLKDGIWELRPANVRLLFFVDNHEQIVLLGFMKKTNKTPNKYIELATRYKNDYLERINNEEEKHSALHNF